MLQLLFSGSCLWRWNDKLRPVELSEIDKQGHKMLLACALWRQSGSNMALADSTALGTRVIEGALFEYFYRLIITDIKPPVFYHIKGNPEHYRQLTQYVLNRLEPMLSPLGSFWERMRAWHNSPYDEEPARDILNAAHLYASQWEFKLIRPHNPFDEEMDGIGTSFTEGLAKFKNLPGMAQILAGNNALARFANLCGQLRFQIRWTQAARLPATSVLGHMFMVAACAYFFSLSINAGQARACNNFFSGLFHDFPELLTRDIISPVKSSIPDLSQLIKEYEEKELMRRVIGPLRNDGFDSFASRIAYYLGLETGSEFQEACIKDGKVIKIESYDALRSVDKNEFDPKDGRLLKICDLLAAFLEAHNSITTGVSSPNLLEARSRLKNSLLALAIPELKLDALLADFD